MCTCPKNTSARTGHRRPLPDEMLAYAASDTRHLHELADLLTERLDALGRRSWAQEESSPHGDVSVECRRRTSIRSPRSRACEISNSVTWPLSVRLGSGEMRSPATRDRAPFRVAGDSGAPGRLYVSGHGTFQPSRAYMAFRPSSRSGRARRLLDRLEQTDRLDDSELVGYPRGPAGPRRPST